ncbi:MAG: Crp/Fnr family transcriptional regulator [Clostridiales bacterium]|nr:Crp/Fnr family transcriptional regulator [Clostridiales bacterium]
MSISAFGCYTAEHAPYITTDAAGWEPVLSGVPSETVPKGTIICRHYGTDRRVILIHRGLVTMSFIQSNGLERVHFLGSTGYVFGFRSCLSGHPYGGMLTALTDTTFYKIPSETVMREMQRSRDFFQYTMYAEYTRGLMYSRKLELLALPTNMQKVAALLLSMAYKVGVDEEQGTLIPIRLTHDLIARLMYTDRVSVSRVLSILEKERMIARYRGLFRVLDFDSLIDIVEK